MMFEFCASCGLAFRTDEATCLVCGEARASRVPITAEHDLTAEDLGIEQIHDWSQLKHEIVEAYLAEYTKILTQQSFVKRIVYADAFAGTGYAENVDTGEIVPGSATRAMQVHPPFTEIHLIEQRAARVATLRSQINDPRVTLHHGDADSVLRSIVLPRCRYEHFARAIVFLDPYGLSVPWTLLEEIGNMKSVEIFFNFMVVGANRNVLWRDLGRVSEKQKQLMDYVWGDRSWEDILYKREQSDLFGGIIPEKRPNALVAEAYQERLRRKAGFKYVPRPIPVRNSRGATLYYLFFASHNQTADRIVRHIFSRHSDR